MCDREGVFDTAVDMIRQAKRLGFNVTTNTTIFKDTSIDEIEGLCKLVTGLGVDGLLLSPAYHYESVKEDIFLTRREIQKKFERVLELSKRYPLISTPMYLEFAAGKREYDCSPWSTIAGFTCMAPPRFSMAGNAGTTANIGSTARSRS